ncbi:MAG: hypothetical protein V3R64_05870, partial [Sphingomonadales bacterium]
DIHAILDPGDQDYFYKTRSERIKMPLENLVPLRGKNLGILKTALIPLKSMLAEADYFSGPSPLYPDFIAFGAFKWAAASSPLKVLEGDEEIQGWFDRMENFYQEKIRALEEKPLL